VPAILAAFLGALLPLLRALLVANVVGLAVRVLAGLGIYFLVMDPIGDLIGQTLSGRIGAGPQVVLDWVGYLQVDVYLQAILSAYSIVWVSNFILRVR